MIEVKGLSFSYPDSDVEVFSHLNFSLQAGRRIGITGANGSGKTTLFHLIMGLLRPTAGQISVFNKPCVTRGDFFEARRKVGLLFQNSDDQLFYPTVEDDIAFGPLNLGKTHAEARAIVADKCETLGLTHLQKKLTHRLSGGEKKLVALTAVAAMQPQCLLLDEPASGLDKASTDKLIQYLKEHCNTYAIATHNRDFLAAVTDKVYVIENGRMKEAC